MAAVSGTSSSTSSQAQLLSLQAQKQASEPKKAHDGHGKSGKADDSTDASTGSTGASNANSSEAQAKLLEEFIEGLAADFAAQQSATSDIVGPSGDTPATAGTVDATGVVVPPGLTPIQQIYFTAGEQFGEAIKAAAADATKVATDASGKIDWKLYIKTFDNDLHQSMAIISKSVSTQINNLPLTPVVPTPPPTPSPIPAPAPSPEDPMRAFNASNNAKIEQQLNLFCTNAAAKSVELMREIQNSMVVAAAIVAASKESTKHKGAILF